MVAGSHVGFRSAYFVQIGQQCRGERGHIQCFTAHIDAVARDDIGGGPGVAQLVLVAVSLDVIDQALIQRPGVQLSFPVIDNSVAKPEYFSLLVGDSRGEPGFFCGCKVLFGRVGNQPIGSVVQRAGGNQGIFIVGVSKVGIVINYGSLGSGFWLL